MSSESALKGTLITEPHDVAAFFAKGAAAPGRRLAGIENEKLALNIADNTPITYTQARDIYQWLADNRGYAAVPDPDGNIVGVKKNGVGWSLEPGLQMETAGSPHANLHELAKEVDAVLRDGIDAADANGVRLVALGFQPLWAPLRIPQRPGDRYVTMHAFNDRVNSPEGHGMMNSTATTQVSHDYTSARDAERQTQAASNIGAALSALFNNSAFRDGGLDPSGLQSVRNANNNNIMAGRYGFPLEAAFRKNGKDFFDNIAEFFINDVPMMGYYRDGRFRDAMGLSFKDFMKQGGITTTDFVNHQKTVFPYVRPQPAPGVIEERAHDTVPQELIKAMAGLYVGLMHDDAALDEVLQLTRKMKAADRARLHRDVPRTGLQTQFSGKESVQHFVIDLLTIADRSLRARNILDENGRDESVYLQPLWEIATSGLNWSQRLTQLHETAFGGDIHKTIKYMDYASNGRTGPSVLSGQVIAPPEKKIFVIGRTA